MTAASFHDLKRLLDDAVRRYNRPGFIADDPIRIPHRFERLQDREIMGFWTATLAWGNRKSIIRSAEKLAALMDDPRPRLEMPASVGRNDVVRVQVAVDYPCRVPGGALIVCGFGLRKRLLGEAALPNQGASFAYGGGAAR